MFAERGLDDLNCQRCVCRAWLDFCRMLNWGRMQMKRARIGEEQCGGRQGRRFMQGIWTKEGNLTKINETCKRWSRATVLNINFTGCSFRITSNNKKVCAIFGSHVTHSVQKQHQ